MCLFIYFLYFIYLYISCTGCLASNVMREEKVGWHGKDCRGIALFPLHSQAAEKVAFSSETDDLYARVASFESRPAKICSDKRYPFILAPLILSSCFSRTFKVRGLNIHWQCYVTVQRVFVYRRTKPCREGSTDSRYTTPITLSVLSAAHSGSKQWLFVETSAGYVDCQ